MKSERHGQAKVLTPTEIERLFAEGFESARDRAAFIFVLTLESAFII